MGRSSTTRCPEAALGGGALALVTAILVLASAARADEAPGYPQVTTGWKAAQALLAPSTIYLGVRTARPAEVSIVSVK